MSTVIKVGGSLFDVPDLGEKLHLLLDGPGMEQVLLVPGGGHAADVVRDLDHWHRLGEEESHWLALAALVLNARFLAALLSSRRPAIISDPGTCPSLWRDGQMPIIDAPAFARADEGRPGCLPHCWAVTSDSLAARVAAIAGVNRLILLKSTALAEGMDWDEAGRSGFVDPYFAEVAGRQKNPSLEVTAINFREWPARRPVDRPGNAP